MKKTCLLSLLLCVAAVISSADAGGIVFNTCKISAGNSPTADAITVTGRLTENPDFTAAETVQVALTYNDGSLPPPGYGILFEFPVNSKTYKNNTFKSVQSIKIFSHKFQYSEKTRRFTFTAKTYLSGFSCPFTMTIQIGDYTAEGQLDETLVNGPRPCPFQLLMGYQDSLKLTRQRIKLGKSEGTDSISLQGLFTVGGDFSLSYPFTLSIGDQAFTVSSGHFKYNERTGVYTCRNAPISGGGLLTAKLDTNKCRFTADLKNITLRQHGIVDFNMDIFGNSLIGLQQIDLGPKTIFSYDELTMYNTLGALWDYDAQYTYDIDGETGSGTTPVYVDVVDANELINGYESVIVYTSTVDEDYWFVSYTDPEGTHGVEWGLVDIDGMGFAFYFNSDQIIYPNFLRMPNSFQDTGAFTGYFDLDIGYETQTSDLTGTGTTYWKLYRYDDLTVPAGTFTDVVVSQQIMSFAGQMHLLIDDGDIYYDQDIKLSVICDNIYWSDPNAGIVSIDQLITINLVFPGIGTLKATSNTIADMTDYLIPLGEGDSGDGSGYSVIIEFLENQNPEIPENPDSNL